MNASVYTQVLTEYLKSIIQNSLKGVGICNFQHCNFGKYDIFYSCMIFFLHLQVFIFTTDKGYCKNDFHLFPYLGEALSDKIGIIVLNWPGISPNLNPIENCWYIMCTKVASKKPAPKSEF